MTFDVTKASDGAYATIVEINTLKDLMAFVEKEGSIVVKTESEIPHIIIYDDYLE